jgi:hypothetical protein
MVSAEQRLSQAANALLNFVQTHSCKRQAQGGGVGVVGVKRGAGHKSYALVNGAAGQLGGIL